MKKGDDGLQRFLNFEVVFCLVFNVIIDSLPQLLEIPYEKQRASLVIVLPFSKTGLSVLLKQLKLAPDLLNDAIEDMTSKRVIVSMPKFKIQSNMEITPFYKSVRIYSVYCDINLVLTYNRQPF